MRLLDGIGEAFTLHCEAMVHGSNFHLPGRIIHDRVIGSMMPMRHFYGSSAQGEPKELMAETDAEQGHIGIDNLADDRERIFSRGRGIPRSIG